MNFNLLFKYADKKNIQNIIYVYESDSFYYEIIKNGEDNSIFLIPKEMDSKSLIKQFNGNVEFLDTLEIDISGMKLTKQKLDSYTIQIINSKGLNCSFEKKEKPFKDLTLIYSFLFICSFILTFIFNEFRWILIISDILIFLLIFYFSSKYYSIKINNNEIKYFSTVQNKNLLDNLYLLQKEKKLQSYFDEKTNISIVIMEKVFRPKMFIYKIEKENCLNLFITDDYIKYAIVEKNTEEQDISELSYSITANDFTKIEDIIDFLNSVDLSKTTLIEDSVFFKSFTNKFNITNKNQQYYPLKEKQNDFEVIYFEANLVDKYEQELLNFLKNNFEKLNY